MAKNVYDRILSEIKDPERRKAMTAPRKRTTLKKISPKLDAFLDENDGDNSKIVDPELDLLLK